MKRNDSFRTDKFSLFLFGMVAGLLSTVSATHAQTQLTPLAESAPAIRSPRELIKAAQWSQPPKADTDKADILQVRVPAILNRVAMNPELAKTPETQPNSVDSIRVDSSAFNLDSQEHSNTVQVDTAIVDQPEAKLLQPLKYAVNWSQLQPIKQPKQVEQAKPEMPPIVSPSDVATTGLTTTARDSTTAKQIAASSETSETAVPKASLAFLRKPIDIAEPTTVGKEAPVSEPPRIKPNALLQPISTSSPPVEVAKEESTKPASLAITPKYGFQTPLPAETVSLFVDGPDYLSLNQVGEYEIAVVNSSSDVASVSRILLQVPNGVEIVAVQREAEINNQERTLSWSIDQLGSGEQQRIRFRVKSVTARKVDFPVTVSQDGRESQTISQTTIIQ